MSISAQQLFDQVDQLVAKRPFRCDGAARLMGADLRLVPELSSNYFAVYKGGAPADSAFDQVEMRIPTPQATASGGLLILQVKPEAAVTQEDLLERLGKNAEPSIPSPSQPPQSPLFLIYRRDWGSLKFGFAREHAQQLTTVVLDATQA